MKKTISVERRVLQNDLLCLQMTNLFIMTQELSMFRAHRSDAGQVCFSSQHNWAAHLRLCLKRLPQVSLTGVATTALL